MSKGLTIARLLSHHTPHRIIGADTSTLSPGRFSNSLSAFRKLAPPDGNDAEPYIGSLLETIKKEGVDLWISCSSVVAAVEDGTVVRLAEEAMGDEFQAVQFRQDVVEKLHEKDKFIEYIRELGLAVPESHRCRSAEEVLSILLPAAERNGHAKQAEREGKKGHAYADTEATEKEEKRKEKKKKTYILKPIAVNDRARNAMMTHLPLHTPQETKNYIKNLAITPADAFQLQRFIQGAEYCTHALVIRGRVKAFVACPSKELLMHYRALPAESALARAMLRFTEKVARDGGMGFSGPLWRFFPIECNPRAHTAVSLFSSTPELASAYLSIFDPPSPSPSIWLAFGEHVASWRWRDGTFMVRDPVPFLVLYHVYWPWVFVGALIGGRGWSRVNVSTGKVFEG
ncbi:hypothetical protein CC80DRAFT_526943 [Byssothecium circinans]|uniref:ATP-grasp domain-containing protein n=1 Tax=Byssothecium circinans TaxID=147558 RepID=A0A6A5TNN0_9PLEO|nr:hypothetical protein CC80DRAFT_526943 [Byssothecium circinans]